MSSERRWPFAPALEEAHFTSERKSSIWIDLDNSPHVPLFAPIIRHYEKLGKNVILTARDHSQTVELVRLAGLDRICTVIGRHHGKKKLNKLGGLIFRTAQLSWFMWHRRRDVRVALSHGSRAMVLAARLLGLSAITMYDYEHTETSIFNRFSTSLLVPEGIPEDILVGNGVDPKKLFKYPGLKEELYISGFQAEDLRSSIFRDLKRPELIDRPLVVLRPPATTANYHSRESEVILRELLSALAKTPGIFTVIVPRTDEQRAQIRSMLAFAADQNFELLGSAVDGLQLAYAADVLISGGGTMNREAALLGVPVYSIFAGKQGALDANMEADGRIQFIRTKDDIEKIRIERRPKKNVVLPDNTVEQFVIEQIDKFLI